MKHLKLFSTEAQYTAFKESSDFVLPNVSYAADNNIVYYNPYVEKEIRLICTYNVTDTTNSTKVCENFSNFASMEVDGILLDSVTAEYTFDTVGEHTVEFTLKDTSIGNSAFYYCQGLTSVVIPDYVTSIGTSAFDSCYGLTSINIPDSVTSIGESAFYNCTGLTSITIPNSVTSIGDKAFQGCIGLTSLTIGSGVKTIGNFAFGDCSRLTSINIPDSVTSIGNGAFSSCGGLTSIVIPNSVTSIGDYAFEGCYELSAITSYAVIAPTIGSITFKYVKSGGTLYVPAGSDYNSWMSTDADYLGYYNWTIEYI